jgi:hypothetical protein
MAKLPVNSDNFSLGGLINVGAVALDAITTLDKPFDEQLARGEGKFLSLSLDPMDGRAVALGPADLLQLELDQSTDLMLDIIWPDEAVEQRELLRDYNLRFEDDEQIYLALMTEGRATVGTDASFPTGGLSANVGLDAGGSIGYTHLMPASRTDDAGDVLRDLARSVRLPVALSSVEDIPRRGEVIAFHYGGYLDVKVGSSWGYSVRKFREGTIGALELSSRVDIASSLELTTEIRAAGSHTMEVRRGSEPGWVRIITRKHRESERTAAADIHVNAELETEGLPEDADQFLQVLLGLQTPDIVADIDQLLDEGKDAIAGRLKTGARGLTDKFLQRLYEEWFDSGPTEERLNQYFNRLRQVIDAYEAVRNIDEGAVRVLERYARDPDKLHRLIDTVLGLPERTSVNELTDSEIWEFLQLYLGDQVYAFMTSEDTFEAVQDRLSQWKARGWQGIVMFMNARQDSLDLQQLFGDLDELLQTLDAADNPRDVLDSVEPYLLQLADRLVGEALDRIPEQQLQSAIDDLAATLDELSAAKKRLYDRFVTAINGSGTLDISASYGRASETDALIDVEIDIREAPDLLTQALFGDFTGLVAERHSEHVKLRPSVFTNRMRTTSHLQVDLLGWTYERFRELVFKTEETVRSNGEGLLHVYDMEATEEVRRRQQDEEIKMTFIFGLLAEGRTEHLIDTISKMSASYTFSITDPKTSSAELKSYLRLARYLQVLPHGDLDRLLGTFRSELGLTSGDPWGRVEVNYRVRYDPDVLLNIFRLLPEASLNGITREAFRRLTAANYQNFGGSQYEAIAQLIQDDAMYKLWKTTRDELHLNVDRTFCYEIPSVEENVCIDRFRRKVLDILYEVEDDLVDTLLELDGVLDAARAANTQPEKKKLERAFRRFVKQRNTLEKWMTIRKEDRYVNPLFAILDKHISVVSDGKGSRSALEIVFNPETRAPVRKVFVS